MKRLLVGLLVLGVASAMTAMAEAEKAADVKAPVIEKKADVAKEVTLKGKLESKKEGDKVHYMLVTADGKVALPEAKDLDKMVGKEIEVVGHGDKANLKAIKSVKECAAPKTEVKAPVKAEEAK